MAGDIEYIVPIHLGASPEEGEDRGAKAIAKAFGVSRKAVAQWANEGAPIVMVGGKYQCRYDELWKWLKENKKRLYEQEEKG